MYRGLYICFRDMIPNKKYRNISRWFLLFSYLFLIGLSILHHHQYDFNVHNILSDEPVQTASSNDIIQDYTGNCIVHHFSSNLLNYFYSSSVISDFKPPLNDCFNLPVVHFLPAVFHQTPSLRAPPVTV